MATDRPPVSGEPSTAAVLHHHDQEYSARCNGCGETIREEVTLPASTGAALDVERLRDAMERTALRHSNPENRAPGWGVIAHEVAAEYARLSQTKEQNR